MQHHEHEESHEPAPLTATPTASLRQEAGDIQTKTNASVGASVGEPAVELDSLREHNGEASGAVVLLTDPEQIGNALFLKSEKIVYCPIQKVMLPFPLRFVSLSSGGRVTIL